MKAVAVPATLGQTNPSYIGGFNRQRLRAALLRRAVLPAASPITTCLLGPVSAPSRRRSNVKPRLALRTLMYRFGDFNV